MVCVGADGVPLSIPVEWTNLVEPSFERKLSAEQAYVLIDDLLALADQVGRMKR